MICGTAGTLLKAWSSKEQADWVIIFSFPDSSEEGRDNPGNMPILSLAGRHELALSLLPADQKLCSYVSAVSAWAKILYLLGLLAQLGAEPRLHSFSWCQCKQRLLASPQSMGKISSCLLANSMWLCQMISGGTCLLQTTWACSKFSEQRQNKDYIVLVCCSILVGCSGFLLTLGKTNPSMCITKIVLAVNWISLSVQQSSILISTFPTLPSASEENNLKEVAFSQTSCLM